MTRSRPSTVLGLLWRLATDVATARPKGTIGVGVALLGVAVFVLARSGADDSPATTDAPRFELPAGAALCSHARSVTSDQHGVVWISADREYQGIDFYFATFSSDGKQVSETASIGWGYNAEHTCGIAADKRGYAVVWPHWDDIDNDADLTFRRVSETAVVAKPRQLQYTKYGSHIIESFRAAADGFVLHFHTLFDDSTQMYVLDGDGNVFRSGH